MNTTTTHEAKADATVPTTSAPEAKQAKPETKAPKAAKAKPETKAPEAKPETKKPAKAAKRGQRVSVTITPEMGEALEYIAERFGFETLEDAIEKCVVGFHGRTLALDTHSGKVAAVKEAIESGKALPEDVKFRRYTPIFKQAKLDEPSTEAEVKTWAHSAPVRAVFTRPAAK